MHTQLISFNRTRRSAFTLAAILALWTLSASSYIQPGKTIATESILASENTADELLDTYDTAQLQQQRQWFIEAEKHLKSGDIQGFNRLFSRLHDYPLSPYLEYRKIHQNLQQLSLQEVDAFFRRNPGQIISARLRRDLIRYYERHQRWQDLLHVYTPQSSPRLQCAWLNALIKTGQSQQALPKIQKLWLSSRSQPRSCDPVFSAWEKAGYKTPDLVWQRIARVMSVGKTRLARHLSRSLPASEQKWVSLWQRVYRRPQRVATEPLLKRDHPYAQTIALQAIQRLSRRDPQQAIDTWQALQPRVAFNRAQRQQVYRYIGLAMARQHYPQAGDWLDKIPSSQADSEVLQWRIRSNIRQGDWPATLSNIEALPPKQQARLRWQFWWAYANARMGRQIEADSTFRYLASRRDYYGFLAADQLGLPYAFENRPLAMDNTSIEHISQRQEARRAHELYRLGRILDARREWYQLTQQLDSIEKLAAAKLAQSWQWHDRAIYTLGQTPYRDDIALRFPLPLQKSIRNWSQKRQLDPALTYAIIRRESAFMADAHSPAGALGLMQLMPTTARHIARKMQVRYRGKSSLLKTETNIQLGTGYLEQMLERNHQQTVLATAAYNAGPHRVDDWLPEESMEAIRWIETIPYTETRRYVRNVLAYMVIYQYRMGQNSPRLTQSMPQVPGRESELQTAENHISPHNRKS